MIYLAYFLVFVTGFTGLVYQILWQKYLSLVLGSHAGATSLVLACFFLFMALGYFVIGHFQHKTLKHKMLLYGVIEGLIGFYALVSPQYFHFLSSEFSFAGSDPFSNLLQSVLAATLLLAIPTFLMGGTIPILTQALASSFNISHRIHANIYSINTFGAFFGTLVAGFYMLETFGLSMSLTMTGLLNVAVMFVTYLIYKKRPHQFLGIAPKAPAKKEEVVQDKRKLWLYLVSFVAGFYVFSFETILIKMASVTMGSSAYTYTIIVATFIFAIAIGSRLVGRISRLNTYKWLFSVQLALLLSVVSLYFLVEQWPQWVGRIHNFVNPALMNFGLYHLLFFFMFFVCLLLPVGLMGMNLPLLFSYLRQRRLALAHTVGLLYGYNAVGSFFGAVFGGYWLYFYLDGSNVFKFSIFMVLLNFVIIFWVFGSSKLLQRICILLSLGLAFFTVVSPNWDVFRFVPGAFQTPQAPRTESSYSTYFSHQLKLRKRNKVLHSQFDPNLWAVVVGTPKKDKGFSNLSLFLNGKAEAGTGLDKNVRGLNALLPMSIAPKLKDVFIVGLGASLSAGIVSSFDEVQSLDVAEISQSVIATMPLFDKYSYNVLSRMNKIKVHAIDAFRKLKESKKTYDVVISEPTNLWVNGVDILLTPEFLQRVKSRLKREGIYSQWLPAFSASPEIVFAILKNFVKTFPWVTLWRTGAGTYHIMAGFSRPKNLLPNLKNRYLEQSEIYQDFGFSHYQSILGRQVLPYFTSFGLANQGLETHSFDRPIIEFLANRSRLIGQSVNLNVLVSRLLKRPVPANQIYARFLAQDIEEDLAKNYFADNLKIEAKKGTQHDAIFYLRRLKYLYTKQFPQANVMTKSLFTRLDAIVQVPANFKISAETLTNDSDLYKKAKTMQLVLKPAAIIKKLPKSCSSEVCKAFKKTLLQDLGSIQGK